jgi:acetyltransferase-like isoleucine patch superfamily enzyme
MKGFVISTGLPESYGDLLRPYVEAVFAGQGIGPEDCCWGWDFAQKISVPRDEVLIFLPMDRPYLTGALLGDLLARHTLHGNEATAGVAKGLLGPFIFSGACYQEFYEGGPEKIFLAAEKAGRKAERQRNPWGGMEAGTAKAAARVYRRYARAVANRLMAQGVVILDPRAVTLAPDAQVGRGTVLYPGTILQTGTVVGEGCLVGPNTRLTNTRLADRVQVQYSVAVDSEIGEGTTVGPFAYIRPNCKIGRDCKIGDFVEVKNATLGDHTHASHLTYVGDSDVGEHVNFGCGTVTVNYNGRKKFRTVIKDNAFIGCNTNLVAPVTVGEGAFTAAGSTITADVPDNALAIARARQTNKEGWARP